jgi:hypothetical protein
MAHAREGRRNPAAEAVVGPAPAPAVVMIVRLSTPVAGVCVFVCLCVCEREDMLLSSEN